MGVPTSGSYKELLNSDDAQYGGGGVTNGTVRSKKGAMHGFDQHVSLTLPPLSTLYFSVPAPRKRTTKPATAKKPARLRCAENRPGRPARANPSPNRLRTRPNKAVPLCADGRKYSPTKMILQGENYYGQKK